MNFKNNPIRCNFAQFFIPCKLLYMFEVMLLQFTGAPDDG